MFFLPPGSKWETCEENQSMIRETQTVSLSSRHPAPFSCPPYMYSLFSILNNPGSGKLFCPHISGKAMEAGRPHPKPRTAVDCGLQPNSASPEPLESSVTLMFFLHFFAWSHVSLGTLCLLPLDLCLGVHAGAAASAVDFDRQEHST